MCEKCVSFDCLKGVSFFLVFGSGVGGVCFFGVEFQGKMVCFCL